jgi:hypothetical protein
MDRCWLHESLVRDEEATTFIKGCISTIDLYSQLLPSHIFLMFVFLGNEFLIFVRDSVHV